ncbi:hypothetical protein, partial [Bradyrhizobium sp. Leo170]|uniref:hypothetical protein n=1 Tax=Bradyrhizobium sp. Leo170 TaxID=1571199 RepID=UPI001A91F475
MGKGALRAVPTIRAVLAMVGTLRFAHPTASPRLMIQISNSGGDVSPYSRGVMRPRFASLSTLLD